MNEMNTVAVEATTVATTNSINELANEILNIVIRLRKVTNPWDPTELTERAINKVLFDCELQFENIITDLITKAGYKVEDAFDEMFLNIFVSTVREIGTDFSAVKKLSGWEE